MTQRRSKSESEIPLFLIPHVIARQIKERGDDVYRISVKRTHWHHYNVTVRTKSQHRELRGREKNSYSLRQRVYNPDDDTRDDENGGAI